MSGDTLKERYALEQVTDRLTKSFSDRYSPTQVGQAVDSIHHRFDDRPIRDFVPVLVERMAREELRESKPARN